ncbi:uncharacterized protein BX664DRAFT_358326 [Halteromyces radiatus]|uniref:uncharacterized protein n=1 Tax=Halteromyces radiatus TaxID=101107 RepID=UPI00221F9BFF|nr:uncharacterized protein BX664DRAFT_358326 [Halteromyces radiatus]KAI8088667.1 hypothetical protein BX664DRAFT_358326 [Halteromyces radiatus]
MTQKRPLKDINEMEREPPQRSSRESKKCNECRRRHVKCDEQRPKCSNCIKTNAECSYSHRGIRYDHISNRQKRDDMYTEIDDLSKRVEVLLTKLQKKESNCDDVARLAIDYGWQVTLSPDGQKQIITNIETTSQLAALVPNALGEVYIPNQSRSASQPPLSSSSSSSSSSVSATSSSSATSPHDYATLPTQSINSLSKATIIKPRKTKRITLERYVAAYTNPSIHVLNTAIATCPSLFTAIMSPRLLSQFAGHPQLSMLHTSACCTLSLNSCIHNPQGLFTSSTLASFDSPTHNSTNGPGIVDLNHMSNSTPKNLLNCLGTDAEESSLFPFQPRFAECTLANLYWNLLKTAKLLDDGNFSQAYVNLGVMITKAFNLELHRPSGYIQFNTALEREAAKRIFWSIWLFDTQMPLFQEGRPSIKLEDITIDKPCSLKYSIEQGLLPTSSSSSSSSNVEEDEEDLSHADCLRYLVEVRYIRVELENTLASFQGWDDDKAILSMIIQQMRMLRRYYEHLDDDFKMESYLKDTTSTGWKLRAKSILLLEHAMNWLVLFDRFLPLRNEEKPVTPFPANLAIHFCREAANAMTLVFEKWLSTQNDCQFRWFFSHFVNCLEIHKYIATYSNELTVRKWKAYASLNFMMYCLREIPVVDLPMGRRVHNDLCQLVVTLRDIVGNCWNPTEEHDLIDSFTKYFADWRPSFDSMDTNDSGSLFAKESSTMFIIIHMQKKGKSIPSVPSSGSPLASILPSSGTTGVTVA